MSLVRGVGRLIAAGFWNFLHLLFDGFEKLLSLLR